MSDELQITKREPGPGHGGNTSPENFRSRPLRILHLEDDPDDAGLCRDKLARSGWSVQMDWVATREEFTVRLWATPYDVILVDYQLKDWLGTEVVDLLRKLRRDIPVVLVSGSIGEENVAEALRCGVADYVVKDHLGRLPMVIERVIAERVERADKKRLAEERDRFFMLSSDLLCIVDGKGSIVQLNPQWQRTLGFSIEDLVRQPLAEWIHPQDRKRMSDSFRSLAEGAFPLEFETRCVASDGTLRWLQWRASSVPRQSLVYATARDITERRQAEHSLQESEARKSAIMEASPDCIINLDAEGKILEFNPAAARTFGWEGEEGLGRELMEAILPPVLFQSFGPVLKPAESSSGTSYELGNRVELMGLHSSGSEFPFELVVTCTHACDPPLYTAFLRDISERKATEEFIREQAALLDKAHEAIWVEDLRGAILYWNLSSERLYGWTPKEALGTCIEQKLLEAGSATAVDSVRQALLEKGEWKGEITQLSKAGRKVTVLSQRTLVRTSTGQPKSVLVINSDITEKKVLEAQLLRAQRIESIGTLANGIAHDLNNVLTPIIMAVDILQECACEPRTQKLLKTVLSSAQHGSAMVKQILAFSKGMDGEKLPLQIRHLVHQMRDFVRDTFPRSIEIHSNVSSDLWLVNGDSTQLHQVLLNLCVNARDAMPRGGRLTMEVANRELDECYARLHLDAACGPYVLITVSDSGTGISPALMEKIFEPFFTTKDQGKGTGLGLSTVLGIVKGHGGFLNVYSEPGKGSRFSIYLPAIPNEEISMSRSIDAGKYRGRGECVMVIDDEASFREITRSILEKYGYRTLSATEGAEALALMAQHRGEVDLAITDMMMPQMDGTTTLRALRTMDPRVRLLATSGMPVSDRFQPLGSGERVSFLLKPYSTGRLLQAVHEALGRSNREPVAP